MSKTKTKRARRELKRKGHRKAAAYHRKAEKAATTAATNPSNYSHPNNNNNNNNNKRPPAKKQKTKTTADQNPQSTPPKPTIQASQKHNVPFGQYDHILLVGEGDFSFTKSLVSDHGCANVTATSYDTDTEVHEKYPAFSAIEEQLAALSPPVPFHHGIDATKLSSYKQLRCERDDSDDDEDKGHGHGHGWDTIAFMFPHTGGLSTHVNRQVRANQALLVSFFKSCLDVSTPGKRLQLLQAQSQAQQPAAAVHHRPFLRMGGKIIVALFEGEPYTLWNIRDLARHTGLKVVESWKFDWKEYPSYGHVRTLGTMEGGGAWRGEDREARMYVFEKIPLVADEDEEKEMGKLVGNRKTMRGGMRQEKIRGVAVKKRGREESDDESD